MTRMIRLVGSVRETSKVRDVRESVAPAKCATFFFFLAKFKGHTFFARTYA